MKRFVVIRISLVLAVFMIPVITMLTTAGSAPSGVKVFGNGVRVGAFKLHVQIKQRRVHVMEQRGSDGATVPSTGITAEFVNWDEASRHASVAIALTNTGSATLFGPIQAILTKLASPKTILVNADAGAGPGSWTVIYGAEQLGESALLSPAEVSRARAWVFHSPTASDFQVDIDLTAGLPVPPGLGVTIEGPGGTSVTVEPDSIPYEVLIDVFPVDPAALQAPTGQLSVVGAVKVTFQPTFMSATLPPPSRPLKVSIPAPANGSASDFIVAEEILIDSIEGSPPAVKEQLALVDTASLIGQSIVTDSSSLPGIFGGGVFAFIANTGSGFATGTASDAGGPRPGVVVSNSTNTLVAVSNAVGTYTLYISGGPFAVTGFDPFRGSSGSAAGNIVVSGSTIVANIPLTPLATPPITRDGIRNGGFERGDVSSWAITGAAATARQLGPTSTGVTILPTEGEWMADINTGPGSIGAVGSGLKQTFRVPAGVRALRLDFNFVSEEFPEFVGSIFDDSFRALITTPNGQSTFGAVSVNQSGGFQLIGDCGFPGGDGTCGQTGWRQASVDLSPFSGTGAPITVELLFEVNDAGDNIFDTHVLVDNIRFSTVWVDVKIIDGATSDMNRVRQEVLGANEILSQAGINVRIRGVQTVPDPGGLLDTDITWTTECRGFFCFIGLGTTKGVPTAEELALMAISRSATPTDANIYYVRSLTGGAAAAIAIGPDDFHDITILGNSGSILRDVFGGCVAGGHVLAHEFGHLLISPQRANDALEHSAGSTNFMGGTCAAPLLGIVTRGQSANINRTGAALLVP